MGWPLSPAFTLESFFGSDIVYCQRISPTYCSWLSLDEQSKDMMTGGSLTIAGDMPQVCSAAVSTPKALQLLKDAGLPVPEKNLFRYRDKTDYLSLLRELSRSGKKVAAQYLHHGSELPEANCWIPTSALSFVNNKANLGAMVDACFLPQREVIPFTGLADHLSRHPLPNVVKAVTDEPTGAGLDVVICETSCDVRRTEEVFGICEYVVVEEFLQISRNLTLNYAVTSTGETSFLGCTEQVSDRNGQYLGNWLGVGIEAPAEAVAIGARVVKKGFNLGYFGLVGIDMAVLDDGRIIFFDLNFRITGSTASLLLTKSILETFGRPLIRLDRFAGNGTYQDMLDVVYREMGKGNLVPTASYDPEAAGCHGARPRLIAMVLGETRDGINGYKRELEMMGLSARSYRKQDN
jgi:hypothetical protein